MFDGDIVLGVDTHKDIHVAVIVDEVGRLLCTSEFPVSERGCRRMLAWQRYGTLRLAGVEGTGSYGYGVARQLQAAGVEVREANRPNRSLRQLRGKSDPTDAEVAGRAALSGEASAVPKDRDGPVGQLRALMVARRGAVKARTQTVTDRRDRGILNRTSARLLVLRHALPSRDDHEPDEPDSADDRLWRNEPVIPLRSNHPIRPAPSLHIGSIEATVRATFTSGQGGGRLEGKTAIGYLFGQRCRDAEEPCIRSGRTCDPELATGRTSPWERTREPRVGPKAFRQDQGVLLVRYDESPSVGLRARHPSTAPRGRWHLGLCGFELQMRPERPAGDGGRRPTAGRK
jgi:hypothetical protein